VPEWGIRYPSGKLLLFEYCSQDNFERYNLVKGKMIRYRHTYPDGLVLFVIDALREKVEQYVRKMTPCGDNFFFTDYQTFKNVPIGQQLTAPIYIWGEDGQPYPLKTYDQSELA
jgi:hypothetical protein